MRKLIKNIHNVYFGSLAKLIVLLSLLCVGCQSKDDSFSPYCYYLKIRFEDQSGNDLVKGIMYLENEKGDNTYELSKSVYQLDVAQTGKSKEKLFLSPMYVHKTETYEYLFFTTSTLPLPDYRPASLTHTLTCPHIFGDKEEHTILSHWKLEGVGRQICTSVVIDGKTYPVVDTDSNGESIILVTLDR